MTEKTWPIEKLGRTARIGNGSTPRRDSTIYWGGGYVPWLNSSVVNESRVTRAEQFVTAVALRECHLPIVAPGSVLVGLTGQGKTRGMATVLDIEATLSQHVAYVAPDLSRWFPEYLLWSLRAAYGELRYLSEENGSTKGGLTCEALKQFRLAAPPLAEQRRIAAYLDEQTTKIDMLIEEQRHLIDTLRERRRAVISSALTPTDSWVHRRIKRIGETSLGKMLDAGRAVRDGDQPRPYVRAADVRADGSVNLVDLNEMPFSDTEMEVFDLRASDVLLIEGGATVGRPGFMFESAPGIAFQKTVNRLRVGFEADARFVYWSMLRLYESAYYANHYGSVSFVHLTGEKLREIELHLPPLAEQRAIAVYLDEQTAKIDALIEETERFIELARERRAALITAAVTGQIDVREMA